MSPLGIAITILLGIAAFGALIGFVAGRISTYQEPPPRFGFPELTDEQLAFVIHEAARAYKASTGDFKIKAWKNVHPIVRKSTAERIGAYRKAPMSANGNDPFLYHLQCAIADLGILR